MKTIKALGLLGLAVSACFAAQAFATTCPMAPATGVQTQGSPVCIAPVGQDGAGTGLNSLFGPGGSLVVSGPGINIYNGQANPSSLWEIGATGASENKLVLEIAGNANVNSFGIFDPTNSSNVLQIFSGPASAGASATLMYNGGGQFSAAAFGGPSTTVTFGDGALFGYYLDTPYGYFYSVPSMNAPGGTTYPDGMPHMVAYQGGNGTRFSIDGKTSGPWLSNEYLLAWEDSPWASSDLDYNDFVVMVESVTPVPEPADLAIFGFGILLVGGFVALRRRRLNA
ncbi:MAG TPA: PEP-CTERM sorting domain-containing protein [Rhodanobacteraceae bacterium]